MKKTKRKAGRGPVVRELMALGRKVQGALQAAAGSRHVSGIKDDAVGGVRHVGRRLSEALEDARKSEELREVRSQARKVVSAGRKQGEETVDALRANIAEGLRMLSRELAGLAGRIRKK